VLHVIPALRRRFPAPAFVRRTVVATLAACAIASVPANASFLNDMYAEMSANMNVQGAKIYETQRAGVITGGGLVWKTPRKTYTPFNFTPPSLKAGCGGVDMFMGSFSMMSKDEFIQMLRAVGQNASGLLFQLALSALSPELSGLVQGFSEKVEEWNRHFGNSCKMAESIAGADTPLGKLATKAGETARGWGRSVGIFSDQGEAVKETQANGYKVYQNTPPSITNSGTTVFDKETNITWSVLKTGVWSGLSWQQRRMIMTLLGTVVLKWTPGTSPDKVLYPVTFSPLAVANLKKWVGSAQDASTYVPLDIYHCSGEFDSWDSPCLNVALGTYNVPGMAKEVYASLHELRQAILERRNPNTLPSGINPRAIAAMTNIPIGNIINLSTTRQYPAFGEIVLSMYADAIAYDISTRLMDEIVQEITKAISQYEKQVPKAASELADYRDTLDKLASELRNLREEIDGKIQAQNASTLDFMKLEEEIYGRVSLNVIRGMRFQGSRQK
jgi:conjugative transfer pilus assembly protein TraH